MHHQPEDGMDIRKEFEFVLSDKPVKDFFHELRKKGFIFQRFESLETFIRTINDRTAQNFEVKDACLLELIARIQATEDKSAGLNLITYLLAPGLQRILREIVGVNRAAREGWLNLWKEFFQSVQHYPLTNRPHKVAANLLFDTYRRIRNFTQAEQDWRRRIELAEGLELKTDDTEPSPDFRFASALIEGEKNAGLNKIDLDLIISSRVYGESMKSLAKRLGLDYHNALKRRYRAEKHLRIYWRWKIDTE